jgi:hypothetical protein
MINEIEDFLWNTITATAPELAKKIFPDFAKKGTPNPCLVYQLTEGDPDRLLDSGPGGQGIVAYQLRTYSERRRVANEIRDKLAAVFDNPPSKALPSLTIEVTEFAALQNTYERETEEYGALAVVRFHWRKKG